MYNLVSFDTPHHNKDNEYTHHPFKKKKTSQKVFVSHEYLMSPWRDLVLL